MGQPDTLPRKVQDAKDDIQRRYLDKQLSRKVAAAMLKDLKFEDWEIDLFLDGDDGEFE